MIYRPTPLSILNTVLVWLICGSEIVEEMASDDGYDDHIAGGTVRWMTPEIIGPDRYGYTRRSWIRFSSKSTDIHAVGMTTLEVCTSSPLLLLSQNLTFP